MASTEHLSWRLGLITTHPVPSGAAATSRSARVGNPPCKPDEEGPRLLFETPLPGDASQGRESGADPRPAGTGARRRARPRPVGDAPGLDRRHPPRCGRHNDKRRVEFSDDGTCIRTRQGHPVSVDLGLEPTSPLYMVLHSTAGRHLESVLREGLRPMNRLVARRHEWFRSSISEPRTAKLDRFGAVQWSSRGHAESTRPGALSGVESVLSGRVSVADAGVPRKTPGGPRIGAQPVSAVEGRSGTTERPTSNSMGP